MKEEEQEAIWCDAFERMGPEDIGTEVDALLGTVDLANRGVKSMSASEWRRAQMLFLVLRERAASTSVVRAAMREVRLILTEMSMTDTRAEDAIRIIDKALGHHVEG